MSKNPRCSFCSSDAEYLAASSDDVGKHVKWRHVCADHIEDWNLNGDWEAPVYRLYNVTLSYPVKTCR